MSVRNRPKEYLKRSALADHKTYPSPKKHLHTRPAKTRDIEKAVIDDRFYFTFKKDNKNG